MWPGPGPSLPRRRREPTARRARWPLKLHRVLLAPAPTWQETLAVAMEGSGLIHGGLEALFQMGQSFQEQHYSGADEAFAKAGWADLAPS
ncbi:unnamed protein product [Effrenium voratum]|nr:unnamed protein product [Effrenium voratum]